MLLGAAADRVRLVPRAYAGYEPYDAHAPPVATRSCIATTGGDDVARVFGERAPVLLRELAARTGRAQSLEGDLLGLTVNSAAALLRVVRAPAGAARAQGLQVRTIRERALLVGVHGAGTRAVTATAVRGAPARRR